MMQSQALLKKIVPEFIELFHKRYTILRSIYSMQPIGRRTLALSLNMGERAVRTETSFLKEAGMLRIRSTGMEITPEGKMILEGLMEFDYSIKGLYNLENQIEEILNLDKVFIVPGDADGDELVLSDIGKVGARFLKDIIKDGNTISITGGSTVGAVVDAFSYLGDLKDTMVVPARGGMGGNMEYQSNTLAAAFAKKLGGHYRMLHVPGQLRAEVAKTLLKEPDIRSIMEYLKNTDILIYGMGKAEDMAVRRNLSSDKMDIIRRGRAVAEAFGYFFDRHGDIVFSSNPIGISIQDLKDIPTAIGVVGGKQKAQAVMAFIVHCPGSILIMDEGIAREILDTYEQG
ncbi:MAG TPA: sugar-binding domain-containing protein [Clostridia bacterium]|nr:sugar-binding domain-containing protein [Clostridia bacterium]